MVKYFFLLIPLFVFGQDESQRTGIDAGLKPLQEIDRTTNFPRVLEPVKDLPDRHNLWVFIMAGQSNMAGRGFVSPQDTLANHRILTVDIQGSLIYAKEPLHRYEPMLTGLDCGLSFAHELLSRLPDTISVLLLPTAVGGSSVSQWLEDAAHRNVSLLSNFFDKVTLGKQYGIIKGILWHQGESDANENALPSYQQKLEELMNKFRNSIGDDHLPILIGELGSFSENRLNRNRINHLLQEYAKNDPYARIIETGDLEDKGDKAHFNAQSLRTLGKRYAQVFLNNN